MYRTFETKPLKTSKLWGDLAENATETQDRSCGGEKFKDLQTEVHEIKKRINDVREVLVVNTEVKEFRNDFTEMGETVLTTTGSV